ncbi:MAG TPA: hypothetical protein VE033_08960 [Acetobacteraceae bacterium]|jgi:hypothetical protein|nr:hypothetical protein [Acetobacteraceae bacterium]
MRLLPAFALSAALALGACQNPDGSVNVPATVALGAGVGIAALALSAAADDDKPRHRYRGYDRRRDYGYGYGHPVQGRPRYYGGHPGYYRGW